MIIAGSRVKFANKVFKPPYAPYFDAYWGHFFLVVHLHWEDDPDSVLGPLNKGDYHVELKCLDDPSVIVKGFIHPDELELI